MDTPLALLFVDIADSTQLFERAGDAAAAALTQRVLGLLRLLTARERGSVIKSLGDGVLAVFPSADDGARAALAIMGVQKEHGLGLRAGLHFGPVIRGREDLFGDACNVAARIQAIARPGEILASEEFIGRLSPGLAGRTRLLNHVAVKGKTAPVTVHRILGNADAAFAEDAERTVDAATLGLTLSNLANGVRSPALRLASRGTVVTLGGALPRLTVGRGEGNGLRLPSRHCSRQHAVIDFSRDSFLLTDHSTNGTYIRAGTAPALRLHRDSTKLVGGGLIGFGAEPTSAEEDHVATFDGGNG